MRIADFGLRIALTPSLALQAGWITAALALSVALIGGCGKESDKGKAGGKKVLVIGADGMDPIRVEKLLAEGRLPNLARLRSEGGFRPLTTSIPPQSPVAWSNFMTGAGPGVHGIFDFIHRDPQKPTAPYWSGNMIKPVSEEEPWPLPWPMRGYQFPWSKYENELRRRGTPFWCHLDAAGVPVYLYRLPADYPPTKSAAGNARSLGDMGVPDALGNQGTYQHFSSMRRRDSKGGEGYKLRLRQDYKTGAYVGKLWGPPNEFKVKTPELSVEFSVYPDPENDVAKIIYVNEGVASNETVEFLLNVGEWSDWQRVEFLKTPVGPHFKTMVRFLLQQVRPELRVYTSPLNFIPTEPEIVFSEPADFVKAIGESIGPFYTQGFAEQFNALKHGIFTDEEYRIQSWYVLGERLKILDYALDHFQEGLLFFYFSSSDLQAHMFWWESEAKHPVRTPEAANKYNAVIDDVYEKIDEAVGRCRQRLGEDATVIVLSDHGFCEFGRGVAVNTWLRDEGYLVARQGVLVDTDWSKTRAYSLGVGGHIYLNLRGREKDGIVDPQDRDALLREISEKLMKVVDPQTGQVVLHRIYRSEEWYAGPEAKNAPDLVLGYKRNYRASWQTCLGNFDKAVIVDNDNAWSADHCIAHDLVPGILFSNRKITAEEPALVDLGPSILSMFGVAKPEYMTGKNVLEGPSGGVLRSSD